jgi:anaerobic magnesium-protoporphyrin IX monomethyl ester cyclase
MSSRRIIMVYPSLGFSGTYVKHMPLSLLYATVEVVKAGYDVEIFDQRLCEDNWQTELGKMLGDDVLVLGISVMSGTPITNAIQIGRFVKAAFPNINVVWGGPHATFYPETILDQEWSADYVVSGYASQTFHQLVTCLSEGTEPGSIRNVSWRSDDGVVRNPGMDQAFEEIDYREIPYHLIPDFSVYGQVDQDRIIFSMYSSLGCPYMCSFCSSPAQYSTIDGKKWVKLPPEEVADHLQMVVEKYGANYVYFIDDDSFPSLKHVEGIIDEINRRGIDVKLGFRGARINEIKRMSDEFLSKLAEAGTDIMHIGAETGSNRILQLIRKDCTVDDIIECNEKLARHPEITAGYNFLMGVPTETLEEVKQTRDLMMRLVRDHKNCIIFPPNKFRPLPGTELYDLARDKWNYEMPDTLDEWSKIEVEGNANSDWYSPAQQRFFNLMLISSYFIDNKVMKLTSGRTLFYKVMRMLNVLYRPIALFRMKYGFSRFLLEYHVYRAAVQLLTKNH